MRISRFYLPDAANAGETLVLPQATAHYVMHVLRMSANTEVCIFNGKGKEFAGRLQQISKKSVTVLLETETVPAQESPLHVHLGLALTRGERMDYAIQKSTELGANILTPVLTERCEVKLKGERVEKRLEHWQQIAISACEQSGRATVPEIRTPVSLDAFLNTANASLRLILDHRQITALTSGSAPGDVVLLTGPEGGFTETEINLAVTAGFQAVKLGNRVMRAETAPVAALSMLQWLWGDFQQV